MKGIKVLFSKKYPFVASNCSIKIALLLFILFKDFK
jgi:hypothetical protein